MQKYAIDTTTFIQHNGHILHRIKALVDLANGRVKAGDRGGFVFSGSNLSQTGLCWIYNDGVVCDDASIYGDAEVNDGATVCGAAHVYGRASIWGSAVVHGNANICGDAIINGRSVVCGHACVCGHAKVLDRAKISDYAYISGTALVCGDMCITGIDMVDAAYEACSRAPQISEAGRRPSMILEVGKKYILQKLHTKPEDLAYIEITIEQISLNGLCVKFFGKWYPIKDINIVDEVD